MQMNLVEDEGAAFNVPADWPGEYFPSYLPEGLEVTWRSTSVVNPCIEYTSESGMQVVSFDEASSNTTGVYGIEGAVISYMDINGQTAVVIETEHPENEADYYVGITWDNRGKVVQRGYQRDTQGGNDQNRPQRQKNTQKNGKKVCPVLASSVVLYSEKQLRRFFP